MKFKKYAGVPNVFLIESEEKFNKGDIVKVSTKYGKEVECEIWNCLNPNGNIFNYSYVRLDGINNKTVALKRAEKAKQTQENKIKGSEAYYKKSQESRAFLALAEPIKVGHHSEHRHRALIERNWKRLGESVRLRDEADAYDNKIAYWESKADKIDLSMPECLEFFEYELMKAKDHHQGLKSGSIPVEHRYSVTYANKKVKDLEYKVKMSNSLWGDTNEAN